MLSGAEMPSPKKRVPLCQCAKCNSFYPSEFRPTKKLPGRELLPSLSSGGKRGICAHCQCVWYQSAVQWGVSAKLVGRMDGVRFIPLRANDRL
jgi:hypothetical protein